MNILEIANQATNATNGSLKKGIHTTKLANDLNDGSLAIEISEGSTTFTVPEGTYTVDQETLSLVSLFKAYSGVDDLENLLNYMQEDCLSAGMLTTRESIKNKGVKATKLDFDIKSATSTEYFHREAYNQLDVKNVAVVEELLLEVYETKLDSLTKQQLISLLMRWQSIFISETANETFMIKRKNEADDLIKFKGLAALGFMNVAHSGVHIAAHLPVSSLKTAKSELESLGFEFVSRTFLDDDDDIAIVILLDKSTANETI